MLLVKSRESKSLDKNLYLSAGYFVSQLLISLPAVAQDSATATVKEPSSYSDLGTILSISLSLVVVLAVIFAMAFIMRRFTGGVTGQGQMKVVSSMMAGAKEKIMVLEVGNEQHLIGITGHGISHLAKLEQPLEANPPSNNSTAVTGSFKDKLVEAMANNLRGEKS